MFQLQKSISLSFARRSYAKLYRMLDGRHPNGAVSCDMSQNPQKPYNRHTETTNKNNVSSIELNCAIFLGSVVGKVKTPVEIEHSQD